jgi:hypothetical protein
MMKRFRKLSKHKKMRKQIASESKLECECDKNISIFLQNMVKIFFPFVKISQKMGRKLYFKYLIQNLNVLFLAKIM